MLRCVPSLTRSARKGASYRAREGLEPQLIRERDGLYGLARTRWAARHSGWRADRRPARLAVVCRVCRNATRASTPHQSARRRRAAAIINLAETFWRDCRPESLMITGRRLIALGRRESVTHVIFGRTARTDGKCCCAGWTLDKFLSAVPDAAVHVVPPTEN
jgi:hypothetical protein